jgi:hypothetical protein
MAVDEYLGIPRTSLYIPARANPWMTARRFLVSRQLLIDETQAPSAARRNVRLTPDPIGRILRIRNEPQREIEVPCAGRFLPGAGDRGAVREVQFRGTLANKVDLRRSPCPSRTPAWLVRPGDRVVLIAGIPSGARLKPILPRSLTG